jgi:hypothetical protein
MLPNQAIASVVQFQRGFACWYRAFGAEPSNEADSEGGSCVSAVFRLGGCSGLSSQLDI